MSITEQEILQELRSLDPSQWVEVRDYIVFLKSRSAESHIQKHLRPMTARDLLESGLVGLWADRQDIGDSLSYARELRRRAGHRGIRCNYDQIEQTDEESAHG